MNIYVGNMPYSMSEDDLRNLFGTYGGVSSARLVMDRDTGRAKGLKHRPRSRRSTARSRAAASSWSTRRVPVRNVRVVKAAAAAVSAAAVASDPGTLRVSVN